MLMSRVPKNPFKVLGVSPSSSFETVQKRFNELALKYHPDSASSSSSGAGNSAASADASTFIRIRQAFEYIRKTRFDAARNSNNDSLSASPNRSRQHHHHHHHKHHHFSERDFLNYFYEQTGVRLTPSQRREMIELYRTKTPGYYGGHSWDIARRLSFEQDSYLARMKEYQDHNDGDDIFHDRRGGGSTGGTRSNGSNSNHYGCQNRHASEDIDDDASNSRTNLRSRRKRRR